MAADPVAAATAGAAAPALSIEQQRQLLARLLASRAAPQRTFPASYPQAGLWFLNQLAPASAAYNMPLALLLTGRLRGELLARSLGEIVRRHWTLRTRLAAAEGQAGEAGTAAPAAASPMVTQTVIRLAAVPLPVLDLAHLPAATRERELRRRLDEQAARPFDLAQAPLFRAGLLRLGAKRHVFYLVVHHVIFDGWSLGVLVRELAALYRALVAGEPAPLAPLPIQYVDFALWQRQRMEKGRLLSQLAWWRERLGGLPPALELPTDRPRPPRFSFRGRACPLEVPAGTWTALAELGRQAGASAFMTLLAGLRALLARHAGQGDFAIGSPIANRNRSELEGLIGLFANPLVLRVQARPEESFRALLARERETALAAYAHQDLPFESLVQELRPERDLSRSPLFQVMFVLQNAPLPPVELPDLTLSVLDLPRTSARFDLFAELTETAGAMRGQLEYATDLFEPATAPRLAWRFGQLLAAAAACPERPIGELPLLAPAERQQLLVEAGDPRVAADGPLYVVEPWGALAPLGVPGELHAGGAAAVGRSGRDGRDDLGDLGRPELQAARLVPDPFGQEPGARLVRTDNLARRRPDGAVELLGRLEHRVVIRGFRVQLEEVERALRGLPGVRDAAVAAHGEPPRLVAYVVNGGGELAAARLQAALRERLPDPQVPSSWVALPALPLGVDGRVDRRALPAPPREERAGGAAPPRSWMEELVAGIWMDVLGRERLDTDENVFDLGAHSLAATQVASRLYRGLGLALPLRRVFELPTVAQLARELDELRQGPAPPALPPIRPARHDGPPPLSFAQQRLWLFELLHPGNAVFHLPTALRLEGELDIAALAASLGEVVRRHEVLRTRIVEASGEPVQVIAPFAPPRLPLADLGALPEGRRGGEVARLERQLAVRPFDLARGPLWRAALLRTAAREHTAVVTLHHVIADGWSRGLLTREISAAYAALATGRGGHRSPPPLPALPIQFSDYAVWQRQWLAGEVLARELDYWRQRLADPPDPIDLPFDRPRGNVQRHRGGLVSLAISAELTAALRALAREAAATLFMVLLTGWQALLRRCSRQDDLVVGTLIANRHRREVENLIGLFVNTLALRCRLPAELSFRQAIAEAREATLGLHAHQDLPFDKLVAELNPPRHPGVTPLFQVLFVLQNTPPATLSLPGLRWTARDVERGAVPYELLLTLDESAGAIQGQLEFDADLFDAATVARMAVHLVGLLRAMADDPQSRPLEVELLSAAERQQLLHEWNDAAAAGGAPPAGLDELLAAQARRRPQAVAAVCGAERLTYSELDGRIGRAAHALAGQGFGRGDLLALAADRGLDFLVAVLAALRRSGAWLPLDPAHPEARLAHILAASGAALVVAAGRHAARIAAALSPPAGGEVPAGAASRAEGPLAAGGRIPRLVRLESLLAASPAPATPAPPAPAAAAVPAAALPPVGPHAGDLAYVIYTSGSTGAPKGAMVEHGGMLNHLWAKIEALDLSARDVVAQNASQCFDVSVWQLFASLAVGGAVRIVPDEIAHDPARLLREVGHGEITILEVVPAVLRAILDEIGGAAAPPPLASLRWLVVTGESLAAGLCDRWLALYPRIPLLNAYGPTECSDDVSHQALRAAAAAGERMAPIGRPLRNTRLYVLDPRRRPLPSGVAGELYVGGDGVGRGYLRDPALTAACFVPDALSGRPGARLYRTGDRVRWLRDGRLDFLGRLDQQVKVRGFRIELGEVEAALRACREEVDQAVVVLRREGDGAAAGRLVAYCTPPAGPGGAAAAAAPAARAARLRAALGPRLPEYMIPGAFAFIERLPLNRNGKIDYRALPEPEAASAAAEAPHTPPRTATERALAAIWQEVLGQGDVGVEDSFFDLGGHSLLATRVLSSLRTALGVELPLRELFEAPSLAALADRVDAALAALPPPAMPNLAALPIPEASPAEAELLSFAQERLWFLDQFDPGSPAYNLAYAVRVTGQASPAVFARTLAEIARRHEVLRSTFRSVGGRPRRVLETPRPIALPLVSLSSLPAAAADAETLRLARGDARQPFDLERGPLVRAVLLAQGPGRHVLLLDMHHIVSDGWSMGVLLAEIAALYPALAAGRPSPLPELPLQYADYACWQRELLAGERLGRQLDYWKQQLAGAPPALDLPGRGARAAAVSSARGGSRRFALTGELPNRLRALSRRQGATLFMTLLAAFAALLHRASGAADLMIGVPVAGRSRRELETLIGFFVNTLVLRVRLDGAPSGAELVRRVRRSALDAFTHQDVPFEKLVAEVNPERDLDRSPLFQVMFALQNAPIPPVELPGLRLERLDVDTGTIRFELYLELFEAGGDLEGSFQFSLDLFDRPFIARLAEQFRTLAAALVAQEEEEIAALELLSAGEQAQLVREWSDSARELPLGAPFARLFAGAVARWPERTAVAAAGRSLSYRELDRRAGAVAAALRARGAGAESVVALLAERGPELLAVIVGAFAAGAAYLPLDPTHPPDRIARILAQGRCRLAVAARELMPLAVAALGAPALAGGGGRPALLELEALLTGQPGGPAAASEGPAAAPGGGDHLAYVIFTSGSTGVPKGAMLTQQGLINHLLAMIEDLGLTAADAMAQTASQCFDISVWQLLAPLLVGGRVEIYSDAVKQDPGALLDRFEADRVAVVEIVPSLLRLLLEEARRRGPGRPPLAALRWLIPTGEAVPPELCRDAYALYPRIVQVNGYGPAECSDDVSLFRIPPEEAAAARQVAIGRPIANAELFVLDRALRPVPSRVAGELAVGGAGVGRGYLHDPARTAAAFVPDPCSGRYGSRLYRTGDLARWRDDGNLEFLGRFDHQVKIRGYRLELGEIESALLEHPAVAAAAVAARPDPSGAQRLVAWVVPCQGAAAGVAELREHLKSRLPEYAVPSAWMALERLPLSPNGKVDRGALPAPEAGAAAPDDRPYVAPRTDAETRVAAVFAAVIGLERVGAHDNFFELGGHSLLATQAIWRLREDFGVELALRTLFEAPTVAELAAVVEDRLIEQIEALSEDEVDALLEDAPEGVASA
jgi:amino acid adenylation domain-containing protein